MKADGTTESGAAATTPQSTPNAPAKAASKAPVDSIGSMIEKLKPQLAKALPQHVTPERLARVALTAVRNNPRLAQCESISLLGSIMTAAQLGLEPNTPLGECYLIPYKNGQSGQYQAQFQMGYKGLLSLAHRSGMYRSISAYEVDKADEFRYNYGLYPQLHHVPADMPSAETTHYYSVYKLANGGEDFKVWSRAQVEAHAKQYSQSYKAGKKDSPWFTAFDSMAKKTVLIDLLRYAPKSVEIATAVAADHTIRNVTPDHPELEIDSVIPDFAGEDSNDDS
jgi:recombination protein RecT